MIRLLACSVLVVASGVSAMRSFLPSLGDGDVADVVVAQVEGRLEAARIPASFEDVVEQESLMTGWQMVNLYGSSTPAGLRCDGSAEVCGVPHPGYDRRFPHDTVESCSTWSQVAVTGRRLKFAGAS